MRETKQISLGGTVYYMRPTHNAHDEVEARTGLPLRQLYTSVITGMATLSQMATIVHIGMMQVDGQAVDEKTGSEITVSGVSAALWEKGVLDLEVIEPIAEYLAALGWTPAQRKKIEAEAAKAQREQTLSA